MKSTSRRISVLEKPQVVQLKIPEYMVTPTQKEDLRLAYTLFETPENSGITLNQAKSIMWNFGFWKLTEMQFEHAMLENNINTSKGRITWDELLSVITKKYYAGGKILKLREMFEIFDKKSKGIAPVSDIHKVLRENLEFSVGDNEINEILEGAKIGESGEILFEQFASLYILCRLRYI